MEKMRIRLKAIQAKDLDLGDFVLIRNECYVVEEITKVPGILRGNSGIINYAMPAPNGDGMVDLKVDRFGQCREYYNCSASFLAPVLKAVAVK